MAGTGADFATSGLLTGAAVLATGGFAAGALATGALATGAFTGAAAFTAVLAAFAAGAFATVFEPAALGATFAVLFGIALLFLEDATVLPALRTSLVDARARLFVALRLTADAFLEAFEAADFTALDFKALDTLFLRVFWATTNRAEPPRPCLMIFGSFLAAKLAVSGSGLLELCP